jgi:WD40 repeat protein
VRSEKSFAAQSSANQNQMCNPPFIYSLAFQSESNTAAVGLGNGSVGILTSVPSTKLVENYSDMIFETHAWSVTALEWSKADQILVSGSLDGKLVVTDLNDLTNPHMKSFETHRKINALAIVSSEQLMVACAGTSGQGVGYDIQLFEAATRR